MVLDECIATPATSEADARAPWNGRSDGPGARGARLRAAPRRPASAPDVTVTNPGQAQFGIIQGGTYPALRTESVEATVGIGFEAYAIGGLSVGEPPEVMYDVVAHTAPQLPADRPRYLMGSGMPDDLIECVARGIDLFDCVLPTRNARNGQLLTSARRRSRSRTRAMPRTPAARSRLRLLHVPALLAAPTYGIYIWRAR